jgi:uncharacterized protein
MRQVAAVMAAAILALPGPAPAITQAPPVPPTAEQHTADCRAPVFATDQLVCADPALRALDSEVATLLAEAGPPAASRWIEAQEQWFLRRSRCAFAADHRACTEAAYRERLALLRPLDPALARQPVRCEPPGIAALAIGQDRIALVDRAGKVAGAAAAGAGKSSWQPFLTATRRKANFAIRTSAGDAQRCRR